MKMSKLSKADDDDARFIKRVENSSKIDFVDAHCAPGVKSGAIGARVLPLSPNLEVPRPSTMTNSIVGLHDFSSSVAAETTRTPQLADIQQFESQMLDAPLPIPSSSAKLSDRKPPRPKSSD